MALGYHLQAVHSIDFFTSSISSLAYFSKSEFTDLIISSLVSEKISSFLISNSGWQKY